MRSHWYITKEAYVGLFSIDGASEACAVLLSTVVLKKGRGTVWLLSFDTSKLYEMPSSLAVHDTFRE